MSQLVVLNLGRGDWAQGWVIVTAQLWLADSATPMQIVGSLPAASKLGLLYSRWQQLYEALYAHRNWRRSRATDEFEIETDETYITDVSAAEFRQLCQQIQQSLNHWLNAAEFQSIDRQLRTHLNRTDEIRVIIMAENRQLLRLPWHLWQWFEDYPKAELALSLPEYIQSIKIGQTTQAEAKILAILGNSQGINVAHDQKLLEQLSNTNLTLLVEPSLETLNQQLWTTNWDILFFAGHSSSRGTGKIHLNSSQSLTIAQLKFALKQAIERGLKLAIFNSCDGLSLAWDLADLHIPQVIVMREPVPDQVAQEFLKYFLRSFTSGQSFYLSVRAAREQLQALETEFPCATWLPVICQNPAELPLRWEWGREGGETAEGRGGEADRGREKEHSEVNVPRAPLSQSKSQNLTSKFSKVLLSSLVVTSLVLGARSLGFLQPLELWAYDRLLTLRPVELPDSRLLIVTIDEAEIQAQAVDQRRGSLSNQALNQLLQRLNQAEARVIGLDVYRDFSTSAQYPSLITQLRQNKRLVLICKGSDQQHDPTGIAPPPEPPENQVGFSDFVEDADGALRRHLLSLDPDPASRCSSPYAFSIRLAFRYLEAQGIQPEFTAEGYLKLGDRVFQRLQNRAGGYQNIDAGGNQILLNYRSLSSLPDIAPHVRLSQILNRQVRPEAIKGKIVLVGVTANSGGDFWTTPYGGGTAEVPGVFIQAHMTSQIISAVLDQRPLLGSWNGWIEGAWILGWSLIGGISILWGYQRTFPIALIISGVGAIAGLTGFSLVLLTQGSWVPLIPAGIATSVTACLVYYSNRTLDQITYRSHD